MSSALARRDCSLNTRDSSESRQRAGVDCIRVRLTVAYDGTQYSGWQVQKIGTGVQEQIEAALAQLFQQTLRLHSSSRTDAGVHALAMVAHVDLPRGRRIPIRKLPLAINAHLPEDIRVVAAARCRSGFHARFDAAGKEYRYFIWNHRVMNPLLRLQAWHVPVPLNSRAMREAAASLLGTHDFKSFAANRNYQAESTIRTVQHLEVRKRGSLITVVIRADGFLYKMCRGIVGTLVQVGQGKIPPATLSPILEYRDRRTAGMSAPALGLVLWRVFYRKARHSPAPERALAAASQPTPRS